MSWIALALLLMIVPMAANATPPSCTDVNAVEVHDDSASTSISISYTTPSPCVNCVTFAGLGGRATGARTFSDVQLGGQALTEIETEQFNVRAYAGLFYIVGPPSGTNNLTATISGAPSNRNMIIWTCSGVHQLSPIGDTGAGTGLDTTPTLTLSPIDSTQTAIDFFASDDATADPTEGANQTVIHKGINASSLGGASYQAGSDGGIMSWTTASDEWAMLAAALNEVSTSTYAPFSRRRLQ